MTNSVLRSLIELAYAGCSKLLRPVTTSSRPGPPVDIDVQALRAGLPLRNLLEQQPPKLAAMSAPLPSVQ
jgi:hypothetical protein